MKKMLNNIDLKALNLDTGHNKEYFWFFEVFGSMEWEQSFVTYKQELFKIEKITFWKWSSTLVTSVEVKPQKHVINLYCDIN